MAQKSAAPHPSVSSPQQAPVAAAPSTIHHPPSSTQVDQIASAASKMAGAGASGAAAAVTALVAAPPQLTVGDLPLGKHMKTAMPVFNLDPEHEATLTTRIVGSPALRIVSAPARLRPSREGFDASRQVEIEFRPTTSGRLTASLEVVMGWPNGGRPPQTLVVPVIGGAHDPMGPTLDEQDIQRATTAREDQAVSELAADRARVDREIRAEEKRDTHFHEGDKRRLGNQRLVAQEALSAVYRSRRDGIDGARTAIGNYKRMQVVENRSLIEELAWLALDIASASIAGGIAKRLEPALKRILSDTVVIPFPMVNGQISVLDIKEVSAGPGIVGFITDGVKHIVKTGTKAGAKGAVGADEQHERPPLSGDAPADFVQAQKQALNEQTFEKAVDVTTRAHDALLPMLKTAPDRAVAAMAKIAKELVDENKTSADEQQHQTVIQWVRYVAQNSLGTVESRNKKTGMVESLTNITGANEKREGDTPLHRQDGLVDVEFTADFHHPERPVKVGRARLTGVRRKVAEHLYGKPLSTFGLPVRASGLLGGPSVSVTVVRDESGNVAYTDNTTVEWQQATWLARKAGMVTNGTSSDEQRGARKLMEQEILVTALEESDLETDHAE